MLKRESMAAMSPLPVRINVDMSPVCDPSSDSSTLPKPSVLPVTRLEGESARETLACPAANVPMRRIAWGLVGDGILRVGLSLFCSLLAGTSAIVACLNNLADIFRCSVDTWGAPLESGVTSRLSRLDAPPPTLGEGGASMRLPTIRDMSPSCCENLLRETSLKEKVILRNLRFCFGDGFTSCLVAMNCPCSSVSLPKAVISARALIRARMSSCAICILRFRRASSACFAAASTRSRSFRRSCIRIFPLTR
mmetsp:Transcript_21057/g.49960  ORF Transcript_21057/g.49960 Transcript_21057/m.49960 type:complete len:251 (+) Transcript_21057:881-1633(+)